MASRNSARTFASEVVRLSGRSVAGGSDSRARPRVLVVVLLDRDRGSEGGEAIAVLDVAAVNPEMFVPCHQSPVPLDGPSLSVSPA